MPNVMVLANHVGTVIEMKREFVHAWNPMVGTGRDLSLPLDSKPKICDPSIHDFPIT